MIPSPVRGVGRPPPEDRRPDELHLAVLTGRIRRIRKLLGKGVHIESVNALGETPLYCAAFGGDTEVVRLLLRLGANPNRRCGSAGVTPVHGASFRGSRRALRTLVEAGGDVRLLDYEGLAPRDYALKQPSPIRRQKILKFLDMLLSLKKPGSLSGRRGSLSPAKSLHNIASRAKENEVDLQEDSVATGPTKPFESFALHKTMSCHLLDQLCITTSLPVVTLNDLKRHKGESVAYTCGGPTVYSPCVWLGTRVTVRRPTPALVYGGHRAKEEGHCNADKSALKWLRQELSVLRRLRHPAFLDVLAVCDAAAASEGGDRVVRLVFQHVPLGSLHHFLHVQQNDFCLEDALAVLLGAIEGLLFLHAQKLLHCGLSSHSLHLVAANQVKLGGFEHAVELQAKGCSMCVEGALERPWVIPWQAPEFLSEGVASEQSEVYSFASIIWELWSGVRPWNRVEDSEISRRVQGGEMLPELASYAPSLIRYVSGSCLKWKPHERLLDFREIRAILISLKEKASRTERVPPLPPRDALPSADGADVAVQNGSREMLTLPPGKNGSKGSSISDVDSTRCKLRKKIAKGKSHLIPNGVKFIPRQSLSSSRHETSSAMDSSASDSAAAKDPGGSPQKASDPLVPNKELDVYEVVRSNLISKKAPLKLACESPTSIKPCLKPVSSTPLKRTRGEMRPDLLPSRPTIPLFTSKPDILSQSTHGPQRPEVFFRDPQAVSGENSRGEYSETRGGCSPQSRPSSAVEEKATVAVFKASDMKKGMSLTNLHFNETVMSAVITRTRSQVSLTSSSPSEGSPKGPRRTISQIKLTLRKVSSSANVSSCEGSGSEGQARSQRSLSVTEPDLAHDMMASMALATGRPLLSLPASPSHKEADAVTDGNRSGQEAALSSKPVNSSRRQNHSVEPEVHEEFIDDEFDSLLLQQPHMQLSICSKDNVLGAPTGTPEVTRPPRLPRGSLSSEEDEASGWHFASPKLAKRTRGAARPPAPSRPSRRTSRASSRRAGSDLGASDTDASGTCSDASESDARRRNLLRNLKKDLSVYLPRYPAVSDTDTGEF